jgi:hypothetical protein
VIVVDASIVVDLVCTGTSTGVLGSRLEDEFLLPAPHARPEARAGGLRSVCGRGA